MHAEHRDGVEGVGNEIAIPNGVDRVRGDAFEAEFGAEEVAIDRECGAGDGAGAQRHYARGTRGGGEALTIAHERPEVIEHPVRAADGLCALHVGVRWHDGVLQLFGLRDDHELECFDLFVDARDRVARPETCGGCDLIIAAASRVQARGRIAGGFVQEAVNDRVDVFVGRDRLLPTR